MLSLLMIAVISVSTLSACGSSGFKPKNAKLTIDKLSEYFLVRQADASDEVVDAYKALQSTIKDKFDIKLDMRKDIGEDSAYGEYEILIGNCDRKEVREFAANLKVDDWGYALVGKKLVIYGGSDEKTLKAINSFSKYILKQHDDSSDILFDNSEDYKYECSTYDIESLSLQGNLISEYTVIYPAKAKTEELLANWFASNVLYIAGYRMNVKPDSEKTDGKEILIGDTNRKDCSLAETKPEKSTYVIGADKNYVCLKGNDKIATYHAVKDLLSQLLDNAEKKQSVKLKKSTVEKLETNGSLTSMSFNVYVGTPTAQRETAVLQAILRQMPDTLGLQEADKAWITFLNKNLYELYDYVGEGTDGGSNGTYSAIFYRKDRFTLKESGTRWLSTTPTVVSRVPESMLNRNYSYALLADNETGKELMVIDTHLDHTTPEARGKQMTALLKFIAKYEDKSIVLTGDFNDDQSSNIYSMVTEKLTDSSTIAKNAKKANTFHNYGAASTLLDYIFLSPDSFDVSDYKVITDKENGILPSDHYPVVIKYKFAS